MQKSNFNLTSLVVIVVLLGLLALVMFPAISAGQIMSCHASRAGQGKEIYDVINFASREREILGLKSVWPKSNPPTTNAVDISQMNFTNSTDYFWALYDGDHLGTREHHPYVREFNLRLLAGGGVKPHTGQGCLKPENNIWTIAKNVRDDMEDTIPVLVTRNLAAESLAADVPDATQLNRRLYFDQEWNTPFGEKEFVIVRKGGAVFRQKARYLSYRCIYNSQTFMTTIPGSQLPVLSYLTPSKEVTPSDAVYQACVTSKANAGKDYGYYWMRDVFGDGFTILNFFLLMGLISCVLIFFRVFLDKQLKASLSAMRPIYWILLWLAVTMYMCCPVIKYKGWNNLSMLIPVALACVFQVLG